MGQIKGGTDKWMGVARGPPLDREGRRTERELPSVRVTVRKPTRDDLQGQSYRQTNGCMPLVSSPVRWVG